jgi:hypothetical protein
MANLEKVMQMKKQGFSENEIAKKLQAEGISPKEISDAINQSKIKQAVAGFNEESEDMQPSMMGTSLSEYNQPQQNQNIPSPNFQEQEEYVPQENQYSQEDYNYQGNYSQQNYSNYPQEQGYEGYPQTSESSADAIIEISEQVFSEKIKNFQKQIAELIEFKTIAQTKIENIEERLRRMEKMFDQLQISIIEKVGNYGKNLDYLKNEVNMVEDSFSKISNKFVNKEPETEKIFTNKEPEIQKTTSAKKPVSKK